MAEAAFSVDLLTHVVKRPLDFGFGKRIGRSERLAVWQKKVVALEIDTQGGSVGRDFPRRTKAGAS